MGTNKKCCIELSWRERVRKVSSFHSRLVHFSILATSSTYSRIQSALQPWSTEAKASREIFTIVLKSWFLFTDSLQILFRSVHSTANTLLSYWFVVFFLISNVFPNLAVWYISPFFQSGNGNDKHTSLVFIVVSSASSCRCCHRCRWLFILKSISFSLNPFLVIVLN